MITTMNLDKECLTWVGAFIYASRITSSSMSIDAALGSFQPTKERFPIHSEKSSHLRMITTKKVDRDLVDAQQLPVEESLDRLPGMPHRSVLDTV
jgi:hypothetical protein